MKKLIYLLSLFLVIGALPVEAKKNNQNKKAQQAQAAKEKEKKAKREADEKIDKQVDAFLEDHDKNKDKSVSLDEYVGSNSNAKSAEEKFNSYNKNKDRYLSKKEIQELLGL